MAIEAEFVSHGKPSDEESELFVCVDKDIVRFANLVAAKEQKKWEDQIAVEIHEAVLEERERIHKAKECCILCKQKGVCNENTKDDETNTAKILGKS
jgi:hypothetical protein